MQAILKYSTIGKLLSTKEACHISMAIRSLTNAPQQDANHFNIIINGGGLVGTTLAAAIAQHVTLADKRVLLLEAAPPFKDFDVSKPYGNRVSAINKKTIDLFNAIGVWEYMTAARVKHVKQMQIWESNSDALIQFQHEQFAEDVACVIENDLILDAMYKKLNSNTTNVVIKNQAKVVGVKLPNINKQRCNVSEVTLENGEMFSCELLVGADGVNSLVRKEMDVNCFSIDYQQMGLVATLKISDSNCDNSVAWQRFLPNGPVALLPLSDTHMSLVWTTTVEEAKHLQAMRSEKFVDTLNEALCKQYEKNNIVAKTLNALNSMMGRSRVNLWQYPPHISSVVEGSRATFPLGFLHASTYVSSGVALIGDAAHRIHPLAGQGVNLGFSDVTHLVEVLAEAAYAGSKLGALPYLLTYEQKSLLHNVPILVGVHALHLLYSTTFSPVVLLRSLGLQLTHNLTPIKTFFMKRAMGYN